MPLNQDAPSVRRASEPIVFGIFREAKISRNRVIASPLPFDALKAVGPLALRPSQAANGKAFSQQTGLVGFSDKPDFARLEKSSPRHRCCRPSALQRNTERPLLRPARSD